MSYSLHFCEDKFERINLYAQAETCCETADPMPGCCDDVSDLELPNTDQQIADFLDFHSTSAGFPHYPVNFNYSDIIFQADGKLGFTDSSPPKFHNIPIIIFCQVFRI
nr:hypothetical protein [Lunatimonas salinarum]